MNEGQQIPDDLNYIEMGGQAPQGINKEKKQMKNDTMKLSTNKNEVPCLIYTAKWGVCYESTLLTTKTESTSKAIRRNL
jgi:hypothetical protein